MIRNWNKNGKRIKLEGRTVTQTEFPGLYEIIREQIKEEENGKNDDIPQPARVA